MKMGCYVTESSLGFKQLFFEDFLFEEDVKLNANNTRNQAYIDRVIKVLRGFSREK